MNYASYFRRMFAYVTDLIILFFGSLFMCLGLAAVIVFLTKQGMDRTFGINLCTFLSYVGIFIGGILYFAKFESSNLKATPGKILMDIQVSAIDGAKISFKQAILRNLTKWLSFLCFGLGFLVPLISKSNRALHDIVAQTICIKQI